MALLSKPDENRLWLVIAALLGVSMVLLFASFQVPWYMATLTTGNVEFQGEFDFNEADVEVYSGGQLLDSHTLAYGDPSAFGDLMDRVGVLMGLGTFAVLGLAALLFSHYRGWFSHSKLIALAWILGVGGIAAGLTSFTLGAGSAGADEISRLLAIYAPGESDQLGRPDPLFWGTQTYAGGELVSAPGVGWLLAILALLNLGAATLLLYQFPAGTSEPDEGELESFRPVGEETGDREVREAPLGAQEPWSRG